MAASAQEGQRQRAAATASNLLLESVAGEVVEAFRQAGARSVLIRGVTTARWLYTEEPRPYDDVDVLVDPAFFARCERLLEAMGFERSPLERLFGDAAPAHASSWRRGKAAVDLHRRIVGLGVPRSEAWLLLSARTETWEIGRSQVSVLEVPGRSLVLALHLAQHGPSFARTREDLERAVAGVPEAAWRDAADLARALCAESPMAAGLLTIESGRKLCLRLGLDLEGATPVEGSETFHAAQGLLWLLDEPGLGAKADLLRRKLFPPPSVVRSRTPWSRAGRAALALAYGLRLARAVWYMPRAVLAVIRLRRDTLAG